MTQTIFIDGRSYAAPRALHEALKRMLDLPDHYGCNADALYDCLSERACATNLIIAHPGEGDVADAMRKISRVIEDLDGSVKNL